MRGFLTSLGLKLPAAVSGGFNASRGTYVDLLAVLAILSVGWLLNRGTHTVSRVEDTIVIIKLIVVTLFIVVGATAINVHNYVPFIPPHRPGTSFGGATGILAGAAQIFIAYVGFDAIAANSAEVKDPGKSMPRGLIGTLIIGTSFFILVSLVLVGMFRYSNYDNNAEPAAWALRHTGHYLTANLLSVVAIVGIFAALIGIHLASSRLLYSFGRDGLLPDFLGRTNAKHIPVNALNLVTVAAIFVAGFLPFTFLANLVSAGTLVAFIMVSLAVYALRPREGRDLPEAKFKMPLYPVLPVLSAAFSAVIFWGLSNDAKLLMLGWFVIGMIIYFVYGLKHSKLQNK